MDGEIWKPVPGFDGLEASNLGRIRGILTQVGNDYKAVIHGGRRTLVSRLVASAFLGLDLSERWLFVCHKDDNPKNNSVENLFLGTPQDNVSDCVRKNRNRFGSKLSEEQVIEIRKKRAQGYSYHSLSSEFGISKGHLSKICNGIVW